MQTVQKEIKCKPNKTNENWKLYTLPPFAKYAKDGAPKVSFPEGLKHRWETKREENYTAIGVNPSTNPSSPPSTVTRIPLKSSTR